MKRAEKRARNISGSFIPNEHDAEFAARLIKMPPGPERIDLLRCYESKISDYGYWFAVSTMWVEYSGWTPISTWRSLFASDRPDRANSIMKPDERRALRLLPRVVTAYRAHRPGESDWIAYTTVKTTAFKFARARGVHFIHEYRIPKSAIVAYFLRRRENELIVLDIDAPEFVRVLELPGEAAG